MRTCKKAGVTPAALSLFLLGWAASPAAAQLPGPLPPPLPALGLRGAPGLPPGPLLPPMPPMPGAFSGGFPGAAAAPLANAGANLPGAGAAPSRSAGAVHCRLAATPLSFGQYAPQGSAFHDSTASLTLSCFSLAPVATAVHATIALSGAPAVLQLPAPSGPAARGGGLRYGLYIDAARSVPWGDGSGGSQPLAVSATVSRNAPLRQQITAYGRVLARQNTAMPGSYAHQLTAVLSY